MILINQSFGAMGIKEPLDFDYSMINHLEPRALRCLCALIDGYLELRALIAFGTLTNLGSVHWSCGH